MKQAQKAMADAKLADEELANMRVEAQSGGGMVKVSATGKAEIIQIKIAKEVVDPDDVETLEDLVTVAVRDAIEQANKLREEKLQSVMPSGLGSGLSGGMF